MSRWAIVVGSILGIASGVVLEPACCDHCNYPTIPFACQPSDERLERCPDTHFCCSDDPATADGGLPKYAVKTHTGTSLPLYADAANDNGDFGMCVRREDIPMGSGLLDPIALNCPVPCNPTWSVDAVATVCGESRICCQTLELRDDDCVLDDVTQRWRAADGRDAVASLDGGGNWRPTDRSTHQDPDFSVCEMHAGDRDGPTFRTCVAQLTTANQRGFCMALGAGQVCPTDPDPFPDGAGYSSVCERMTRAVSASRPRARARAR